MFFDGHALTLPRPLRELPVVLLFGGVITAIMVMLFSLPIRFVLVSAAGFSFMGVFAFVRNKRLACLSLLIFAIPINISKRLMIFPGAGIRTESILIELPDIFLGLGLLLWFFSFQNRRSKLPSSIAPFVFAALSYFMICALSMVKADYPSWAVCELIRMSKAIVLFWFVAQAIHTPSEMEWVFNVMGVATLFQVVMVLIEKYTAGGVLGLVYSGELMEGVRSVSGRDVFYRVAGTFGHPNRLAYFTDFMAPLFFCLGFSREISRGSRLFYFASFFSAVVCLFLSYSRGGWLATSAAIGACALILFIRHMRTKEFMGVWFSLALLVVIGAGAVSGKIYNRFTREDAGSTKSRFDQFQVAGNMIRENILLGVGVNNFVNVSPRYDDTGSRIASYFQEPVHNVYLLTWAETGAVGFVAFLIFMAVIFWTASFWRRAEDPFSLWGQGLFFGFMAYFAHAFVDMNRVGSFSLLFLFVGLTVAIKGFSNERKSTHS